MFKSLYAKYYDDIYTQKDYLSETQFIIKEVKQYFNDLSLIDCLDYGCGTGNHSYMLSKNFNFTIGYDTSKQMVSISQKKYNLDFLNFTNNKKDLVNRKFNLVVSMFDVFSYISHSEIKRTINFISNITTTKSLIFLQFWDKKTVLKYPPKNYKKKLINSDKKIYRSCTSRLDTINNRVKINYNIHIEKKCYSEDHLLYLHESNDLIEQFKVKNFLQLESKHLNNFKKDHYSKTLLFLKK